MIIISAMSQDSVIGSGDGMPWDVPEEYEQYLSFVRGQTIIMGRTSYEIFGPDLDEGHKIVVSRSVSSIPGATVCHSLEDAVDKARSFTQVFSAGGASIYKQSLPLADAMYLSVIKGDFKGDSYFPEFDASAWHVVEQQDHPRFEFFHYQRKVT